MLVGLPGLFAVESFLLTAYARRSLLGMGHFLLHVGGTKFGQAVEPVLLSNSFDAVAERFRDRGEHHVFFASDPDAVKVACAIRRALFGPDEEDGVFFGLTCAEFRDLVYAKHLLWAPDGGAAFDDGSYVVQLDAGRDVRLIAFKSTVAYLPDPGSLVDVSLPAEQFYETLQAWLHAFQNEWSEARKEPD